MVGTPGLLSLPWQLVEELPHMLIRLKALGYPSQAGTTWKLTAKGRKIRGQSQGRVTRTVALRVIDRVSQSIEEINSNASCCYEIDVAVIFGSVLDQERDRVGDVDLAYPLQPRLVDTKQCDAMREAKIANCPPAQARKWYGDLAWPEDEVIQSRTFSSRVYRKSVVSTNWSTCSRRKQRSQPTVSCTALGRRPERVRGAADRAHA